MAHLVYMVTNLTVWRMGNFKYSATIYFIQYFKVAPNLFF